MASVKFFASVLIFFSLLTVICVDGKKLELKIFNEKNWQEMLKGEWLIQFYSAKCPACVSLVADWERLARVANERKFNVAKIDVNESPGLSGRFIVSQLPTVYHVINGDFRMYEGTYHYESFLKYIKQAQWNKSQPLSFWRKPSSLHMAVAPWFFKFSNTLKAANLKMINDYGLPAWCSYAVIGTATLALGGVMGSLMVLIIDLSHASRKNAKKVEEPEKAEEQNPEEESEVRRNPNPENLKGPGYFPSGLVGFEDISDDSDEETGLSQVPVPSILRANIGADFFQTRRRV